MQLKALKPSLSKSQETFLISSHSVEPKSVKQTLAIPQFCPILRGVPKSHSHFRCQGEASRPCRDLSPSFKYLLFHHQLAKSLQQRHPRQPTSLCHCTHSSTSTSSLRLRR